MRSVRSREPISRTYSTTSTTTTSPRRSRTSPSRRRLRRSAEGVLVQLEPIAQPEQLEELVSPQAELAKRFVAPGLKDSPGRRPHRLHRGRDRQGWDNDEIEAELREL